MIDFTRDMPGNFSPDAVVEKQLALVEALYHQARTAQNCPVAFSRYLNEFMIPSLISAKYIGDVESLRIFTTPPLESFAAYWELSQFVGDLCMRSFLGSMEVLGEYGYLEMQKAMEALSGTFSSGKGGNPEPEDILGFIERHSETLDAVVHGYPGAIRDIAPEYGFHFERENVKVAETDRFILYRITPTDPSVATDAGAKPLLILPPYVLGANILGFLPKENRSYAHCYADQGVPTYIRIMKDIAVNPAVQVLTGEDDALDTRQFCAQLKERHGKPVTLNGYCQGGYSAVCNLLSGELDGLVDALITCVSPMDGTRSRGLAGFLHNLPDRFNDLVYGTKTLPGGNRVADGELMGWVYKLKSIEREIPAVSFVRDMAMFGHMAAKGIPISKSAAAINYWLQNERSDLPLAISQMSFASYNTPIDDDGTLPVTLFGRKLNFRRLAEKKIPWLICYGESDDLVEKETALAPLDYIDAEVAAFPKGHVAIATSWSEPTSECALHTRFGEEQYRGPVRFHLDLDQPGTSVEKAGCNE